MEIKFLLLVLVSFNIFSIEYDAIHESTYWYFDEESSIEGWHVASVRSNLVYGDKLRIAIPEKNCDQIPTLYLTLSSFAIADIKNADPNFTIESLEGEAISFKAYIGEYDPIILKARISLTSEVNSAYSLFFIEFDYGMPREFVALKKDDSKEFIEVMELQIIKEDPIIKYFDINEIKFRMGGLVNVWMHANQICLDSLEAKL